MEDDANAMEIDPEIAAAMGFSSFGNQRAQGSKKRRTDEEQGRPAASGANSTTLGVRGPKADSTSSSILDASTTADINVDPVATTREHPIASTTSAHTSAEQDNKKKKGGQDNGGLAAFLSRGQELKYEQENKSVETGPPAGTALPSSLPSKPQFVGQDQEREEPAGGPPITRMIEGKRVDELTPQELNALRRGVRSEKGDLAYFLPSFLEDPWKELSRA